MGRYQNAFFKQEVSKEKETAEKKQRRKRENYSGGPEFDR
jgi:hypothetical protein